MIEFEKFTKPGFLARTAALAPSEVSDNHPNKGEKLL